MKKHHQLFSVFLIAVLSLACWYFFVKKYTYEFEMNTSLNDEDLVEILKATYPTTHPDIVLIKAVDDEFFIFQFSEEDVSFVQEIKISQATPQEKKLSIGVNAQGNFFIERWEKLYKETLVQVFNSFLLLQLDQEITKQEAMY